jgi:hypothetical protein
VSRGREEDSMTDFRLDMTMMFAIHDALRRDLEHVAQVEVRSDGWDLFARMLYLHHTIEDDLLGPMMRGAVAGRSEDLARLDEMETEHAAIVIRTFPEYASADSPKAIAKRLNAERVEGPSGGPWGREQSPRRSVMLTARRP